MYIPIACISGSCRDPTTLAGTDEETLGISRGRQNPRDTKTGGRLIERVAAADPTNLLLLVRSARPIQYYHACMIPLYAPIQEPQCAKRQTMQG